VGRQPFDPESKLHLAMPARGGNPVLTEADLADAIAEVRELQKAAAAAIASAGPAPRTAAATVAPAGPVTDQPEIVDGELMLPHSVIPQAAEGPAGVRAEAVALQQPGGLSRSGEVVRRFFTLVGVARGMEALFIGLGLIFGAAAMRGRSDPVRFGIAATYWVVVASLVVLIEPQLMIR
jgi:hypothetical protein